MMTLVQSNHLQGILNPLSHILQPPAAHARALSNRYQGRSQDFRKGGANLLVYDYITRAKNVISRNPLIYYNREACCSERSFETGPAEAIPVWSGSHTREARQLGGSGGMPPQKILEF